MNKYLNRYWTGALMLALVFASTWVSSESLQDVAETARQNYLQSGATTVLDSSSNASGQSTDAAPATTTDPSGNNSIWGF